MSLHPWNVEINIIFTFQLTRLNLYLFIRDVSSLCIMTLWFSFFLWVSQRSDTCTAHQISTIYWGSASKNQMASDLFFLKQKDDLCSACVSSPLSTGGAVRGWAVTSSLLAGVRGKTLWIEIYQSIETWGRDSDVLALRNRFQCFILVMASATGRLGGSLGWGTFSSAHHLETWVLFRLASAWFSLLLSPCVMHSMLFVPTVAQIKVFFFFFITSSHKLT